MNRPADAAEAAAASPMMAQYLDIKAAIPTALLFYRMGDFYELFFADAELAAAALDIALTKRGKHLGEDIAMCGVPGAFPRKLPLERLIRKGFRVAVCEQMEDPAEARRRGSKSVVHRDVVRLITPGTLTEEALLDPRRHNYLAAWAEIRGDGALAWVDVSTGDFHVARVARPGLGPLLARLAPSEVLVAEDAAIDPALAARAEEAGAVTHPPRPRRLRQRQRPHPPRAPVRRCRARRLRRLRAGRDRGDGRPRRLSGPHPEGRAAAPAPARFGGRRRRHAHRRGHAAQPRAHPRHGRRAARARCSPRSTAP
jgi:hypothetical protein